MTFVLKDYLEYEKGHKELIIASRKSDLARLQSYTVGKSLKKKFPDLKITYHFRESLGDINLNDPLWKMPEKGVFTEDFYQDLTHHRVDLVVHSWKDLPIEEKPQTYIAATLDREDPRDLLLFKKSSQGRELLTLFTSSPRRIYNLTSFFDWALPWKYKKLEFTSVRGNIQTRVKKLLESETADGLIVAKAALDRLMTATDDEFVETKNFLFTAMKSLQFQVIPLSQNPTAAAQGALAIEVAKDRPEIVKLLENINNKNAYHNVSLERSILKKYGGGCHQKIGVSVTNKKEQKVIFLRGLTDEQLVLNQSSLWHAPSQPLAPSYKKGLALHAVLKKKIIPIAYDLTKFFKAEAQERKFLFITKNENLNGNGILNQLGVLDKPEKTTGVQKDFIWTSGVSTWKSLSEAGYWVSGTFDSLGEEEPPAIEALLSATEDSPPTIEAGLPFIKSLPPVKCEIKKISWLKITHEQGRESTWAQKLPTYRVEYEGYESHFDPSVDCYFWSHGELFKKFIEAYPEGKTKYHACGLGSTLEVLKQYLEEKMIIPCLNYEDWKNKRKQDEGEK